MIRLCALDELPDGETRGFEVPGRIERFPLFVYRRGARIDVWRNACPHLGVPLEWQPDRFLTPDHDYFMCATHGALFRLDDGVCVSGPCRGKLLGRVGAEIRDDALWVDLPITG